MVETLKGIMFVDVLVFIKQFFGVFCLTLGFSNIVTMIVDKDGSWTVMTIAVALLTIGLRLLGIL